MSIACLDIGSTFTKGALVDPESATVTARAQTPTTTDDALTGVDTVLARLKATPATPVLACSSAGGGLRLAVVGYERTVTAEAGYRVGLSAGAKVVHVAAGPLDTAALAYLRAAAPDIVLLVGGTDGGNADVLLHNARSLATARLPSRVPVVVAGNSAARDEVAAILTERSRRHVVADNVLPEIGVVDPAGARTALRAAFLRHVIGGKGLSRDRRFASLVTAATPDAVLRGVEIFAETLGGDTLVVDVGGATTDVYSSVNPAGEDAAFRGEVVAPLRHARTVEADLGVRHNAEAVLQAAAREGVAPSADLGRYAVRLANEPSHLPATAAEHAADLELARLCAVVAVRRHARPPGPGDPPRALGGVAVVLGSGGVLRNADPVDALGVLDAVAQDRAGGWPVPRAARVAVDSAYLLVVVGLLADHDAALAARLAATVVDQRQPPRG